MAGLNTLRRARPLLGTLVEVGIAAGVSAFDDAFAAVARVQARMSRFDAASDVGRFNRLPAGGTITIDRWTAEVLAAARGLQRHSADRFDVSLGSGPQGWQLDDDGRLHKRHAGTQLDLGGIAKGFAVDRAVEALQAHGVEAGWVNAGGDLRVFGAVELPIRLRDEVHGGTLPLGSLSDGALCTSRFAASSRCALWAGPRPPVDAHVSVAAPCCLWADALTKLIALGGEADELLQQHGAQAWRH